MKKLAFVTAALLASTAVHAVAQEAQAPSREGGFGLGRAALPEEVAAWDIDIRPDGLGLPVGSGDVWTGEGLFVDHCSACHGDFGEAVGRWPVLAGGFGTLDGEDPVKTIGSYWPYLSTVWDYVHRAMPYGAAQSLSDDEVYAITAYLLYLNEVVDDDFVLSNETFAEVVMPNQDAFFMDDRDAAELPLFTGEPCMADCTEGPVGITMNAAVLDVTPDDATDNGPAGTAAEVEQDAAAPEPEPEPAPEQTGPDPALVAAGEGVFRQCASCHQLGDGARNGAGPILNGVVGAAAAHADGFRYSPAMTAAAEGGLVWTEENLATYLADPRGFVRGTRMAFRGLSSEDDVAAVIAYMQASGGSE